MEIVIPIIIAFIFVALIYWIFKNPKEYIEYEKQLNENLADEYIIDPETGTRLTLEEAETGVWKNKGAARYVMPEDEKERE